MASTYSFRARKALYASMATRDIVVIGASAGGVEALTSLVKKLTPDLPASIFVVQHVSSDHKSMLPRILSTAGKLPARHPADGEKFERGYVYVAPADHHLLLEEERVRVVRGPRENGHRPAADALFRSAARAFGPRVIGVVLTGALDDGTAGLVSVKRQGGFAVVQDLADAYCADMPRAAMQHVDVDAVVTIAELARKLPKWTRQKAPKAHGKKQLLLERENRLQLDGVPLEQNAPGLPAAFSCPACGGVLNEIHDGKLTRFRCRVGHAYNPEALQYAQSNDLEMALWAALRALEEQAELARRLSARSRKINQPKAAARYEERVLEAEHQAEMVRRALKLGDRKQ
jgi:two-component system chemotaxis response regulator CheB